MKVVLITVESEGKTEDTYADVEVSNENLYEEIKNNKNINDFKKQEGPYIELQPNVNV